MYDFPSSGRRVRSRFFPGLIDAIEVLSTEPIFGNFSFRQAVGGKMPARKFASKCLGNRRERDATKFVAGASRQNRNDMHCIPNLLHQGPIGLIIVKAALGFVQNH